MALQSAASSSSTPSAQMVGNAFVEQYYHILHTSPELVYRFYQDSSVLSRPDANGLMTSVSTMNGINEKILSLNFKDYKAEIETADAQNSYKEGVTVLVTGCLMGKDNLRRRFAQSFFLAPQDNGYFVLNDVFRYVEDNEPLENHPVSGFNNTPTVSSIPDPEPSHVPDPPAPDPATSFAEEESISDKANELDSERQLANKKEAAVVTQSHANVDDVSVVVESAASAQEDTPKKSYASIVKVVKGRSGRTDIYVPINASKETKKTEKQAQTVTTAAPTLEPEASTQPSNDAPESSYDQEEEAEGHSIYVRYLPFNVKEEQLEIEFKKFGPIKQGGVQVRYNKQQGYCFGFVEFDSLSSMQSAIQASPLLIGGRQAVVEIKRSTTRVGSGRGRVPPARTGFRSDSFRSHSNYGGGRSFGRNDFGNRGESSGRGRSSGGRGEGYQQGRGKSSTHSSGGAMQNPNSTSRSSC